MPGVKALRQIQLGWETTPGTPVAATNKWRGIGTIDSQKDVRLAEEDIGLLVPTNRPFIPKDGSVLALGSVPATFEQLPILLRAGIKDATLTQDGVGTGYIGVYDFPTTTANSIKKLTVEGGDDQQAERFAYGFVPTITLDANISDSLMMSGEIHGQATSKNAFTGAIAIPTVEEILTAGSVWIDDSASGFGTTQITGTLRQLSLNIDTGWRAFWTIDSGSIVFQGLKNIGMSITGSLQMEHTSDAVTEKDKWWAGTNRLLRFQVQGSELSTSGTTYTYKTLIIDVSILYTKVEALGDADGNDILTAQFQGVYDSTEGTMGEITVVNELTAYV